MKWIINEEAVEIIKNYFIRGGPLMWPLLGCSIISLTIVIERLFFWIRNRKVPHNYLERFFNYVRTGEFEKARDMVINRHAMESNLLLAGLNNVEAGWKEAMEMEAEKEISKMRTGMGILDTIITMAPLLGILGTVLGIIQSFNILGRMEEEYSITVTSGIAQALITTAAGLIVAILTLIPFNYFVGLMNRRVKDLEMVINMFELSISYFKKDNAKC